MTMLNPLQRDHFPDIQIEASSAFEGLLALHVFCNEKAEKGYELEKEWFELVRAKISPELRTLLGQYSPQIMKIWIHLLPLAYESALPRDIPALIAHIEATGAVELRLHMFGYYSRAVRRSIGVDLITRAAEGDNSVQKPLTKAFAAYGNDPDYSLDTLKWLLSLGVEETKDLVLTILRRWYDEYFREREAQIMPILQRDVENKLALKPTMAPARFIEKATNGFDYVPEPFTRSVLLVPSFALRPYICDQEYQNVQIVCYPVADESLQEDKTAPPSRLVRLYKALADERRLRVLKLLAEECYTLQELAEEFGVAKSTMHHHLIILRSASLIRFRSSDRRYSLRDDMIGDVGELLNAYLKRI